MCKSKAQGGQRCFSQVLTLWLLAVRAGQPVNLNSMAKFLCWTMNAKARQELGVDLGDIRNDVLTQAQAARERLKRSLQRFIKVVDPFPTDRKGVIVTKDEFARLDSLVSPEYKATMTERLHVMGEMLLKVTIDTLPDGVKARWKGNLAVDETFVQAVTKRGCYTGSSYHSLEARAWWFTKTGDHVVPEGPNVKFKQDFRWGFAVTTAVMATNDPDRETPFPLLTVGMSFHRPSEKPGLHATRAIEGIAEAGLPAGTISGDQSFGSTPFPEEFQGPVREMGYQLLYIPKPDFRGRVLSRTASPSTTGPPTAPPTSRSAPWWMPPGRRMNRPKVKTPSRTTTRPSTTWKTSLFSRSWSSGVRSSCSSTTSHRLTARDRLCARRWGPTPPSPARCGPVMSRPRPVRPRR